MILNLNSNQRDLRKILSPAVNENLVIGHNNEVAQIISQICVFSKDEIIRVSTSNEINKEEFSVTNY